MALKRGFPPQRAGRLIWAATAMAGLVGWVPQVARADVALSSNDAHTVMQEGSLAGVKDAPPDTLAVIDLAKYPPRVAASIEVPGSVVGPPMAVAVAADESYAIVTSATKADPAAPTLFGPDDRVSVVDLKASPPKIVQQLTAGPGATVVRIAPGGRLALIANRFEGTVSIYRIRDARLESLGKLDLGNPKAGPSGIAILPSGKAALVSRDGDSMVSVLHIDGEKVSLDPRPITAGFKPYTLDINAAGTLAAVSNMGRGDGDVDSISLIDLTREPFRGIDVIPVAGSPEGLKFSPDGRMLAVASQDGTTRPTGSPFRHDHGKLVLFAVDGMHLKRITEAPIGHWSQGVVFSRDGRTLLVQCMGDRQIDVFRLAGARLVRGAPLSFSAGPAAIQASWP